MVKNITIVVLIVLCFMLLVYALVQQTAAVKAQKEAQALAILAEQKSILAEQQLMRADSIRQNLEAALVECGKKGK